MGRGIYIPSYPTPPSGGAVQPGFRAGGFGGAGGGGGGGFSFPMYEGFDDYTEGEAPPEKAGINAYVESGKVVTRAIGYDATDVPNYPTDVTYAQTKQLHRQVGGGSQGVEFDLGDLAINPSTTETVLRMEYFGSIKYGSRGYYYVRLTDTPWGGVVQNRVQYYWTWSSGGSWGRILTITDGGGEVEEGALGGGWSYSYGNPGQQQQIWKFQWDFANDGFGCSFDGTQNTNIGKTSGAWRSTILTGPANMNASLRYLQIFAYGDGSGDRPSACIHAWVGTGVDAWPSGVKQ